LHLQTLGDIGFEYLFVRSKFSHPTIFCCLHRGGSREGQGKFGVKLVLSIRILSQGADSSQCP